MRRRLLLGLTAVSLAACGGGSGQAAGPAVRDSTGIRIVENQAPAWQPGEGWRLSAQPLVDIGGGNTAAEQLYRVRGAARLSDGRVVVADGGSQELRFYASDGRHDRSVGGQGAGPGEFQLVSLAGVGAGDTIWTGDLRLNRVSTFGPTGEFLTSATLVPFEDRAPSPPSGVFPDGSLFVVVPVQPPREPSSDPVRVYADYVRYGADGSPVGSVIRALLSDHFIQAIEPQYGGIAYWSLAFGRTTTVRVHGDRIYIGEGTTYEVRVLDMTGEVQEIVRVVGDPVLVTEQDIEAYREAQLAQAGDDNARRGMERLLRDMPYPTHMPAYTEFLVDASGGLWVEQYNRPGDSIPKWDVFDAAGQWLGTVSFPLRFEPLDIGPDYVLGVWRDPLDVEHLQLYDVLKPPG